MAVYGGGGGCHAAMPSRLLDRELEPYFSNSELVPKPVILRSGVLRSEL